MKANETDERKRTSPLALWRYAHEYLCASRNISQQIRIKCIESQAAYLVAAQGVEFALKAFLRARGESMAALDQDLGHSLCDALESPMPGALTFPILSRTLVGVLTVDDAQVGQAFQGGPVINSNGEVVAVASRSYAPLGFTTDGVFFSVPIRSACDRVLRCPSGTPNAPGQHG